MATGATGQLGLALPVQGELSGTWGDTVNNGITQYTNIAIAGTLTLTNDGAVTLANTTGDASASNITSTLTGAGTVTAQFAIVRVTGTLTTAKVITAPSYSKTYIVVNAATGGIVTFKASGQTGVSIAVGESASVYYNGTDYVKVATSTSGTGDVVGPASAVANSIALFNSTTGKLIKDSSASDGLIYGLTVGRGAGAVATNTVVGAGSLNGGSQTGTYNTVIGYQAATANTTGNSFVAIGPSAFAANTTGSDGVAIGSGALAANTTGATNTAVGRVALLTNTTGSSNTALGGGALQNNTTASDNTAVGYQAGYANTTGTRNALFGHQSGVGITTGSYNTAVGSQTFVGTLTGSENTAVGYGSSYSMTSGQYNTAVGRSALFSNTTASNNTAVGYQAGYTNTTGTNNTAIGYRTLYSATTAVRNTAIGHAAGYNITTGSYNTFIGSQNAGATSSSGSEITTGSNNSILGNYNGNQGSLDIRTSSNNIVLSDGDGNPLSYYSGSQWFWKVGTRTLNWDSSQFFPNPDNAVKLGDPSYRWNVVYAATGTINTSDANQKQNIANLDDAEKRVAVAIKSLIKKYRFKDAVAEKGDAARIHVGAVAQEVQAAFVAEGLDSARYALFCSDTWYEVGGKAGMPSNPHTAETEGAVEVTRLGLRYEELLAFIIAAL